MKKYKILIITLLSTFCIAEAQISVSNGLNNSVYFPNYTGIDYLVVFDQITAQAEIQYLGTGTIFDWYKFSNPSVSISNQNYISPEGDIGYILYIDGTPTYTIWVIDYQDYIPTINGIIVSSENNDICNTLWLDIEGTITLKPFYYQTQDGSQYNINVPRSMNVSYQTQTWGENSWQTIDTTKILIANHINVPAPLVNTTFSVKLNDKFTEDLGLNLVLAQSEEYQAVAVKNKLITETVTRTAENEDKRPDNKLFLEGSAPLDIHFIGNPTAAVTHNQWTVFKENQFYFTRTAEDFRFTFNDFARYKIVLVSSNQQCSVTDSVVVNIKVSDLQVPNVFTPNGDGVNDEFRVAYRSLRSFQMAVYNRWGNKIYESNDPQRGWNGKIGQRDAVAGPYFYYIKAEGTDGKKYLRKGDINLIR